jgi:hypothetical protein
MYNITLNEDPAADDEGSRNYIRLYCLLGKSGYLVTSKITTMIAISAYNRPGNENLPRPILNDYLHPITHRAFYSDLCGRSSFLPFILLISNLVPEPNEYRSPNQAQLVLELRP